MSEIRTFGDVRRMIVDTIVALKDDKIDVNRGMAIAANMKVLNDSIQVEINAAKMSIAARAAGHESGAIANMGQRVIGNESS